MATVAIVLKTKQKLSNNQYAVALRVTHNRISRYISINSLLIDQTNKFRCTVDEWKPAALEDDGLGKFLKSIPNYKHLNFILQEKLTSAKKALQKWGDDEIFDFEKFEQELRGVTNTKAPAKAKLTLQLYYKQIIQELEQQLKIGLSTVFIDTQSLLKKFKPNALVEDVDLKFLEAFEAFLRHDRGNKDTTISVKMRNLQRVLNLAIGDKLFQPDKYPFGEKRYSINKRLNHKTRKRSIGLDLISRIKELDVSGQPKLQLAKDIFLFSFYTRGMNFIDIAALKWSHVANNEIYYIRKKTSQPFYIPINEGVSSIIECYKPLFTSQGYIFPIYNDAIHKTPKQKYTRKKTALKAINDNLKEIAKLIGQEQLNLTTYVSRHSYATNLKKAGVATAYISEALGHQTESQTQIYLEQFNTNEISELESKIFNF
jgi:integrase